MLIKVSDFGGIAPINDRSKLPNHAAAIATNCKFEGGNLRPYRNPAEAYSITTQPYNVQSIFQIGDNQFVRWYGHVSAVKGPVPVERDYLTLGDDFRFYYAGDTGHAIRWPRFSSKFRAMSNINIANFFDGPAVEYPLGVPPPESGPVCTVSSAPAGIITQITNTSPATCLCSNAHGLSNGSRVMLSGMPVSGDGSELNGVSYAVTVLTTSSFKLDSVDATEWEGPINGSFTWTRIYADSEQEDRIYVYTYVNAFGEEGPPSAASNMVSVGDGQTVSVATANAGTITPANAPQFTVTKKRIYRTVSGSDSAQYLFVVEQDVSLPTYSDSVSTENLAEVLSTESYSLPPAYLENLVLHPGGFLIGSAGNRIYCSEPYLPYAWPTEYVKTLDHPVRGIAIFGSTVVVGTDNTPYIGSATDPASLTFARADQVYPCLSGRAMVSTGYSVIYPCPLGLVVIDGGGAKIITSQYYSRSDWGNVFNSVNAEYILAAWHDGIYWITNGFSDTLSFDIKDGRLDIVFHDMTPAAMFVDRDDDNLYYMVRSDSAGSRKLMIFDSAGDYQRAQWQSKRFHLPREASFSAVQVFTDDYDVGDGNLITFTLENDGGALIVNQPVTSQDPFRIPSGRLARDWYFTISTKVEVQSIQIAESIAELKETAL